MGDAYQEMGGLGQGLDEEGTAGLPWAERLFVAYVETGEVGDQKKGRVMEESC